MANLYNMSKLLIIGHIARVDYFSPCQAIFLRPAGRVPAPHLPRLRLPDVMDYRPPGSSLHLRLR